MSTPSYHKINYSLRSSKSIERKVVFETIRELIPSSNLKNYRFIGFGSPFFTDFRLVHRELGIDSLICIEANEDDEQRFHFNKPYKCINLLMGYSSQVLPTIDWENYCNNIVWLDYDGTLEIDMLKDLEILSSNLRSGNFVIITCNGTLPAYSSKNGVPDVLKFREDFQNYVPYGINPTDLTSKNAYNTIGKMFINCINKTLIDINAPLEEGFKNEFVQLFNIKYKDNSLMYTFGGLIINSTEVENLKAKPIFSSSSIQSGESTLDIQAPVITNKEIDLMNKHLPSEESEFMDCIEIDFIPEEFRRSYFKYYRQFPTFIEVRDI